MKGYIKIFLILITLFYTKSFAGECTLIDKKKNQAYQLLQKALKLKDNKQYKEAIKLLYKAEELFYTNKDTIKIKSICEFLTPGSYKPFTKMLIREDSVDYPLYKTMVELKKNLPPNLYIQIYKTGMVYKGRIYNSKFSQISAKNIKIYDNSNKYSIILRNVIIPGDFIDFNIENTEYLPQKPKKSKEKNKSNHFSINKNIYMKSINVSEFLYDIFYVKENVLPNTFEEAKKYWDEKYYSILKNKQ